LPRAVPAGQPWRLPGELAWEKLASGVKMSSHDIHNSSLWFRLAWRNLRTLEPLKRPAFGLAGCSLHVLSSRSFLMPPRLLSSLVLFSILACGDKDDGSADPDSGGLYDPDGADGSDGGDGTDGTDGTDGGDGTDGTDLSGSCDTGTAADLVLGIRVSAGGTACTTCPADTPLQIDAVVVNPCPDALSLTTSSGCLHTSMSLESSTGEGEASGSACTEVETLWEVPAEGELSEWAWEGRLSPASYEAFIVFQDEDRTEVTKAFSVE
jgi:hypothetical protein